jgi:tetratricopeptide (TPR) repeat protein
MLDSPSLLPRLIYTPSGPYAPNGWAGYNGRFAMPRSYRLSAAPINGQAVLAPLLLALRDYSDGDVDQAYQTIDRLLVDYPDLSAPLPRALLGNVLWARGLYGRAAEQYAQALAQPSDEQAFLANNLGAIQLDAGETLNALDSFDQAIQLLRGNDLGQLRFNLGALALADGRFEDAARDFEQARNLLPPNTPLLIALASAYRESGQLASADAALAAAEGQTASDVRATADVYRPMARQRSDAALREQRALLNLAQVLGARGPLLWELEAGAPTPPNRIQGLRDSLRTAADLSQQEVTRWNQRAAADAAAFSGAGQTATGQAEAATRSYSRQRYYQAVIDTELARSRRSAGAVSALGQIFGPLFGNRSANLTNIALVREIDEAIPGNPDVLALLARAQRVAGQLDDADSTYDRVISLAGDRPEGFFGKGLVALDRGDRGAAISLFATAFQRNNRFFPAPEQLARLAESQGDWASAIAQRRILLELRPGVPAVVALTQDLRLSGPAGFAEAEQLLTQQPAADAAIKIELARLYNDAGRADAAAQAYRDAIALDPRSSTAAFELGETLARQGDLPGAEVALRDAVAFDETNVDARLALAQLYAGPLEQPDQAREEYAILLRQNVDDVAKLLAIGDNALQTEDYNQAIDAYERALRATPDDLRTRHKLGQAYLATNRLEAAGQAEQRVVDATATASEPDLLLLRAEALARLGDVARLRGDIAVANGYYTQAQQIDPNLVAAQVGLGLSAVGQGNWGVARGYFESAARLDAGRADPQVWFWLAESLLRAGDFPTAIDAYQQALAIKPQFPEVHLGLAQVRSAQGDIEGGLIQVEEALRQRPNYAEALLFQGKLLQQLARPDEALVAYDNAIRANSRIAESYYRRAMIYISNGENPAAVRDLQRAVQLQPNFPEAHYWMGQAYYAQRRLQNALNAFRQAIALNPNYVEAIYYSGRAAEDLGLRPDAISAYQTVIQLDAAGEWGQLARSQLDQLG